MTLWGTHALLGELDHDAQRLAWMKKRFHPRRIRLVATHDGVASSFRALAGFLKARHLERHVVNAGALRREETVDESVGPAGLEDLEIAAAFEAPDAPVEDR